MTINNDVFLCGALIQILSSRQAVVPMLFFEEGIGTHQDEFMISPLKRNSQCMFAHLFIQTFTEHQLPVKLCIVLNGDQI